MANEGPIMISTTKYEKLSQPVAVAFDGHMGALHLPEPEVARGVTIVICPAAGRDARWTYRSLFLWANDLATAGFHVLRYDHVGEGDSLELAAEADQWQAWMLGLSQAAEFSRSVTGNKRLLLAGMRIGATLAASAADRIRPDGLILLDPFMSGASWLRELRLASAMLAANETTDRLIEVNGLRLSSATIESLEQIDIRPTVSSWPLTLISSPTMTKSQITALGETVTAVPFTNYAKLFKDSHVNEKPQLLFEAVAQWLNQYFGDPQPSGPLPLIPETKIQTPDWVETRVSFGAGLEGVLCLPTKNISPKAIIIGNTGADPRSGVANFATRTCRFLASKGIAGLRFDFRGIGESAEIDNFHVYETDRTDDLRAADALLKEYGFPKTIIAGICTGGFHAVRAVLKDENLPCAVAINSWLVWQAGTRLDREALAESMRSVYLKAPVQARKWLRRIREKARMMLAPGLRSLHRQFFPSATTRLVRSEIKKACDRAARIHVIIGDMDHAREGLEEFGKNGRWLSRQPGISVSTLAGIDHALFSRRSQKQVMDELLHFAEHL